MNKFTMKIEQSIVSNWQSIAKIALFVSVIGFTLYMVGFSQIPAVHDAFHDVRHSTGFPCH